MHLSPFGGKCPAGVNYGAAKRSIYSVFCNEQRHYSVKRKRTYTIFNLTATIYSMYSSI
jgi:hypothetical protein